MNDSLRLDLLNIFVKHGIISEYSIRNELIRTEYRLMRSKGNEAKEVRQELADKYFLGNKTIEKIIYKS